MSEGGVSSPGIVETLDVLCRKALLAICRVGYEWRWISSLFKVETKLSAIELS
jgi:hypothetical protein